MELDRLRLASAAVVLCLAAAPGRVLAGDIAHDDELAPKQPGCENVFVLVSIFMPFFFSSLLLLLLIFVVGREEVWWLRCDLAGFCVERWDLGMRVGVGWKWNGLVGMPLIECIFYMVGERRFWSWDGSECEIIFYGLAAMLAVLWKIMRNWRVLCLDGSQFLALFMRWKSILC